MPDRIAPQTRAHTALGALLARGAGAGLPTITWIIASNTGALTGEVSGLGSTPEQQRATFEAWAALVSAKSVRERTDSVGSVHLTAVFEMQQDGGLVQGAIRARLFTALEDED